VNSCRTFSIACAFLATVAAVEPSFGAAEGGTEWNWSDSSGRVVTRAALEVSLTQHKIWVESGGKKGTRLSLNGAHLGKASLNGANLRNAELRNVSFYQANLSNADLSWADLREANFLEADLSDSKLGNARLDGANLSYSKMERSLLLAANLSRASLTNTSLNGAKVLMADLSYANLQGAELNGAYFVGANLTGTTFEPGSLPHTWGIAAAINLESLTFGSNPLALTQLRKQFSDGGFREQERKITFAINRRQAQMDSFWEKWFKKIAFDITCQYGMNPGRCLKLLAFVWALCSVTYTWFMHHCWKSGIYVVVKMVQHGRERARQIQILPGEITARKKWIYLFRWFSREWRVLRVAFFFSLMCTFNIGFRDINFGRWLRMLTKHEYDLKPVRWVRPVAGLQSLVSVYLVALWVLTYFSRPFE